eukprot:Gb_35532 [translate_table: standard]
MSWWWTICCQYTTCFNEERLSLLAVKDAYPSPRLSSWKALNCCEWNGVHCDPHSSHVVEIHLQEFFPYPFPETNINPVINPALFELKHLGYLNLSHNYLTGAIPAGLFKLQELKHLDLSYNDLTGAIPRDIFKLHKLKHLDLSSNFDLDGSIPEELGSLKELNYLDLSYADVEEFRFRVDRESVLTKISVTRWRGDEDEEQ